MRILLIEDETTLLEQIRQHLEAGGHAVDTSGDGKEGLFLASEYPVDLAVVDLGLPGMPGLDIIRALRARGYDMPILILTARGKWEEKVTGLESGADDYLVKPFHMEELLARVKALLRRATGTGRDERSFGPLRLDTSGQSVSLNGTPVELTAYEYRLLEYLARHPGKVIAKAELADYLYPHDDDRDSNVIEVLIGRLRRKIDPENSTRPIETLRGRGYRFNLEPT
ncbi:response regulator transcription factor [Thiohalomonas denitrificans]|uniref:Two-component system, OmpR family, response regulator PhoP n=1 Tax=Thiohalomonas denitrificans TaxID=415747 RepID=A0A1G5QUW4_9GAMM|nr:response regulator transcription factor [Thiohalomonas denitrificans]SCZ65643.1 two-component system, OmpR family, response regulator PhoP [Thiohalomonas denitrificans]